jgi:hypothetical protein
VSGELERRALAPAERSRLDELEARQLTDEVKRDAEALWRKLLRLYQGQAHLALGYVSWHAYCDAEFGFGQSRSYQLLDAGRVLDVLDSTTVEWRPANEAQARELVPLLADEVAFLEVCRDLRAEHGDDKLTAEKVRAAVSEKLAFDASVHGLKSSRSDEWYTPAVYVDAVRELLGGIDLDPASCRQANEIVRAGRFYSLPDDDGLVLEWRGRVFLNPPFKRASEFVTKLLAEHHAGRVEAAVVLLNAYGFDAAWFQPLAGYPLCMTDHRISFWSPTGEPGGPMNANMFVYLGADWLGFARVFARWGNVYARIEALAATNGDA